MNSIYCILFLTGCIFLCGASAFQLSGANNNRAAAPTFVARIYYPNDYYIRPVPPSKLYSSLPKDVADSVALEEEEVAPNIAWLNDRFNFTKEQEGKLNNKIESSYGRLLTLDQSTLVHRANWLQKRLKLNDEELGRMIRRFPNILAYRPDANLDPKLDYLQERLALSTKALSKMVQKHPPILAGSITESLESKLAWMQTRLHLNETKALQKFVAQVPEIFGLNIDDNLEPKCEWLQERLNLTEHETAKLCTRSPRILLYSLDDNLVPTLNWLEERLDLKPSQLSTVVRKAPTILSRQVDCLDQKLAWLQQRLVLDDASLKKIVVRIPTIMGLSSSTNLDPTLQWLEKHLFLAQDNGVGRLIKADPALLSYSIETNLQPTLAFFKECIGDKAAVAMVVSNPRMFHASLEWRLKPRLEQVEQLGIEIDAGCLQRMAQLTEEKWYKSLDYQEKKLAKSNAKDLLW